MEHAHVYVHTATGKFESELKISDSGCASRVVMAGVANLFMPLTYLGTNTSLKPIFIMAGVVLTST